MEQIITEIGYNLTIQKTMKWNGIQGATYENFWRDFLNQPLGKEGKRLINYKAGDISELGGGITTKEIGLSPPFRVANILEAEEDSGVLDYTGSRGPEKVIDMFSKMLNSKVGDDRFGPKDSMRTGGGTEAISLLMNYFGDKRILQCGPGYFMQYGKGNNIETLFNEDLQNSKDRQFKTLPSVSAINNSIRKGEIVWIIQPGISGECYSKEEGKKILEIVKEKKCTLVIDTAFEGTEIEGKDIANFYELANKDGLLEKTVFFGSPSKGQGFPGKRLGFLASKNQKLMNQIIEKAGENRDGLALNVELNAMYTFLEIFEKERKINSNISVEESIKNVFEKFDSDGKIFSSIRDKITVDLIKKYINWKNNFFKITNCSLEQFKNSIGNNQIFSSMAGEQKSLFNSFFKISEDLGSELLKKYDINELVRYMFLYNGLLLAPGQNFGGNGKYWENKELIVRGTFTQNSDDTKNAIEKLKNGIDFLLKYKK